MAVMIRMKRIGRKNRPYYRICATDKRSPRDGRVIEEIGTYDPSVAETDARCSFNGARVTHWLSVGAKPSDAVRVLIKKYGPAGTHVSAMEQARARLSMPRVTADPGPPAFVPAPKPVPVVAAAVVVEQSVATDGAETGAATVVADEPAEQTTVVVIAETPTEPTAE